MPKSLDLVLFGATGFTGTQTLLHLAKHVPRGLRWAIAGRNREKLQALLPLCATAAATPEIRIADAEDADSVNALVASTKAIIQLAGPYGATGEVFVAACAEHGTHYLDLTGEIGWVAEMIAKYDTIARDAGARIVPASGFEALPFDIAALNIAEALRRTTGERAVAVEVNVTFTGPPAFQPRDVLSGGTMASIKAMLGANDPLSLAMFTDPALLVTDEDLARQIRERNPYDFRERYDEGLRTWLAPTVPAPFVNPPVLYRSMELLRDSNSPFSPLCEYREGLAVNSFYPYSLGQRTLAGLISAAFVSAAKSAARNSHLDQSARAMLKKLLDIIGPTSGQGPSARHLEQSGYVLHMRARGASGREVTATARAAGHPGYRSTAMLVAEAGLLLADAAAPGCAALPERYGVVTPAAAFELCAMPAWARAELRFDPDAVATSSKR